MIMTNEDWQHGEIPEGWTYICKYPLSMSDLYAQIAKHLCLDLMAKAADVVIIVEAYL